MSQRSVARAGWSALINTSPWFSAAIITSLATLSQTMSLYGVRNMEWIYPDFLMTVPCREEGALQIDSFVARCFLSKELERLTSMERPSIFVRRHNVGLYYWCMGACHESIARLSPDIFWGQNRIYVPQAQLPVTVSGLWLAWPANSGVSLVSLEQMPFKQETHVMEN